MQPLRKRTYVLQAGAVIPAALITGLRADLPGQALPASSTEDKREWVSMAPQGLSG